MKKRGTRIRLSGLSRREFMAATGVAGLTAGLGIRPSQALDTPMLTRAIPSTGERIPIIGMGSWITFNVGTSKRLRDARTEVLKAFFAAGGGMIDSSPMYGSSEDVIGYGLQKIADTSSLFAATKVWTTGRKAGIAQMEESETLWQRKRFDLMQVHNLLDWETHLETLKAWKEAGRIRYLGITTSHGGRHAQFEKIMTSETLDFVQLSYNILDRQVERRLLPLAAERGIGVIVNRPFRTGRLFDVFARKPLPPWAVEIDCYNWAQFMLKFAVSHPAVTCAIPATTRVDHMNENMGAAYGRMPDKAMRAQMASYVQSV
jgi:diketogulonate reductase-like aldo/keto reductase